ncbi:MAG: hypothetical protein ACW99A_19685, partial [Candidatus Kariarchaeaceae archaeon]
NRDGVLDQDLDLNEIQWELLDNYFIGLNMSLIIITWYFIIYQWTSIHENGDYGYWISLGVKRNKFYVTTIVTYILSVFVTMVVSYLVITSIGGLKFETQDSIIIFLTTISFIVLLTGSASILSEIVSKNEIASPIFLISFLLGHYILQDSDNLASEILFPSYRFANYDFLLNLIVPLITGLILVFGGYKLNIRREIEI